MLDKNNMKDKKINKEDIDRGMKLPGMESYINRKKEAWNGKNPSDEILDKWIRCQIGDMITCELLRIKTTCELIDMYGELINVED